MNNKINLCDEVGTAWPDLFGITAGLDGMEAQVKTGGADGAIYVDAKWTSTSAITLSNYNNFPTGSKIEDAQAHKTYYKTGATEWYFNAWTIVT